MTLDEAVQAYLDSKNTILWGRAFALDESSSEAAAFLKEAVVQVTARMVDS